MALRTLFNCHSGNLFSKAIIRFRRWTFILKTMFGKNIYIAYADENGQKIMCIARIQKGRTVWSRHLVVKEVLENKGIPNTQFDKIFEKWN